jgi:hypothetical protein
MRKAMISLLLPLLGLVLFLSGASRPAGAAVQYRESDLTFIRLEGEFVDQRHQGEIEILSAALPSPHPTAQNATSGMAGRPLVKTHEGVKCSDIVVSVVMGDGSVKTAKYDPDARGGCRYSLSLTRQVTGRVKVKFPWLPGGRQVVVQDSPP